MWNKFRKEGRESGKLSLDPFQIFLSFISLPDNSLGFFFMEQIPKVDISTAIREH